MKKPRSTPLAPPPDFVEPQLPASVRVSPRGPGWVHEIKFDGYRLLARVDKGEVRLLTRGNQDWTERFQTTANEIAKWALDNALIDGEIVALEEKSGISSFDKLQKALTEGKHRILHYYVFDCLHLNGRNLMREPLETRKAILEGIVPANAVTIHYSAHTYDENGAQVFEHACKLGVEGTVSKRAQARYYPGRSNIWVKAKCTKQQELVIGGFFGQNHVGSLLMGYYDKKDLIFAGKVGTGFTQSESERLFAKLSRVKIGQSPFAAVPEKYEDATWVAPIYAANIAYINWTTNGFLRHASYRGLREDKPVKDVSREAAIAPSDAGKVPRKKAKSTEPRPR